MEGANVGNLALQLLDDLRAVYGDDVKVMHAGIVVEIDAGERSHFGWVFSDPREWVNGAFMREAHDLMELRRGLNTVAEADEDE